MPFLNLLAETPYELEQNFTQLELLLLARQSRTLTVIGDGATTVFTVDHNLNSYDVHVTVYADTAPKADVVPTIDRPSVNQVRVTFGAAPVLGLTYRVVVST